MSAFVVAPVELYRHQEAAATTAADDGMAGAVRTVEVHGQRCTGAAELTPPRVR